MGGCSRIHIFFVLSFIICGYCSAKELFVGGNTEAWKVPPKGSDPLNKWAEKTRFQVGDHLVWKYDGKKDSVLEVKKEDYTKCNTSNPIKRYNDGNTKVVLDHPGPYYFISGSKVNCDQGEKLVVVVLSPRSGFIPSSPSPAEFKVVHAVHAPAPAPHNAAKNLKGGIVMVVMAVLVVMWGF